MKRSVAIITWVTYRNFGTYLQAFALQQYLSRAGFSCAILDDSSQVVGHKSCWKYEVKKFLLRLLQKNFREFDRSFTKSCSLFDNFKRNNLSVDYIGSDLASLDEKYDIYVCGSDQIWNPFYLDNPYAQYFYAPFTKKKKVSYAPSIGVSRVPPEYKARMEKLVCDFECLSAREQQGVDILHELTGRNVARVVDPTLLLDASKWNSLLPGSPSCKEQYVLAYFLTPNTTFINTAVKYARERGLRLKMFFTNKSYCRYDCDLISAGPIEFLHYVRNAECLLTDSFHGSIFSSIFHTQFFTFLRFKQNAESQNSRVENLLGMMGLGERLLDEDSCGKVGTLPDIDFVTVDSRLAPFIKQSKEYLEEALR